MSQHVDIALRLGLSLVAVALACFQVIGVLPLALFALACLYFRVVEDSTSVEEELEFWRIVSD